MSVFLMQWAYRQQGLSSAEKFCLVTIAHRANPSYFGKLQSLAQDTGLNIKTARRAVHGLIAKGLLTDSGRRRGKTAQVPEYWIVSESWTTGMLKTETEKRRHRSLPNPVHLVN